MFLQSCLRITRRSAEVCRRHHRAAALVCPARPRQKGSGGGRVSPLLRRVRGWSLPPGEGMEPPPGESALGREVREKKTGWERKALLVIRCLLTRE